MVSYLTPFPKQLELIIHQKTFKYFNKNSTHKLGTRLKNNASKRQAVA